MTKFNRRVYKARVKLNRSEASRLGKKGAEAKRAKKWAREQEEIRDRLFDSQKMRRQANEDVCPID